MFPYNIQQVTPRSLHFLNNSDYHNVTIKDYKNKLKQLMSLIQFHSKLKQTIQILKKINYAHSMCGKTELPVLTLTCWEVGALSYFSYSFTNTKTRQ